MSTSILRVALSICLSLIAPLCSGQSTNDASALRIGSGDLLDMNVLETPELSAKLRVSSTGIITLPIGGALTVEGLTADQAKDAIEQRFKDREILQDPHVSLLIQEYASQGISVLGEVRTPGVYPMLGPHGVLDIISNAGGLTPTASKRLLILRKGTPGGSITVELGSTADSMVKADIQVLPGDQIVVGKAGIVYVAGDVVRPGGFLIENNERLSVLQAIALAQGTNRTAALHDARLIHKSTTGRTEEHLELAKIFANTSPDIAVNDGDILFVPTSKAKAVAYRTVEAIIQATVGMAMYSRY